MSYSAMQRKEVIDRLDRSFHAMPAWAQTACKHGIGAPRKHPETGEPIKSFREAITLASDGALEALLDDFEDNGDLVPAAIEQERSGTPPTTGG